VSTSGSESLHRKYVLSLAGIRRLIAIQSTQTSKTLYHHSLSKTTRSASDVFSHYDFRYAVARMLVVAAPILRAISIDYILPRFLSLVRSPSFFTERCKKTCILITQQRSKKRRDKAIPFYSKNGAYSLPSFAVSATSLSGIAVRSLVALLLISPFF
jgi:hypothetical protein